MIDDPPERVRDRRSVEDRWPLDELEDAFRTVGNETRLEILLAVFEADRRFVRFSEIKAGVSIRDHGNLAYHLDKLKGTFVRHVEDEGYALLAPAYYVLQLVLTRSLEEGLERTAAPIDEPCPRCRGSLQFAYEDGHRASIRCPDCETALKERPIPPGAINRRPAAAAAAVVDAFVRSDLRFFAAGVCPHCQGRLRRGLIPATGASEAIRVYDRDESDGAYVEFGCERCASSFVIPGALLLYELAEAAAFFADHAVRLQSVPFWRAFAWNAEGGASVTDDGRLRISVTLDDETLAATFDDRLDPVEVTRRRSIAGDG